MSDAKQQITPDELQRLLSELSVRDENGLGEQLTSLRKQIDHLDEQLLDLLAERMRVSCEIGTYKRDHNMPLLQTSRYHEVIEERAKLGCSKSLNSQFVREILKDIHDESIRQQMAVMAE
jgi:chorismate mutase